MINVTYRDDADGILEIEMKAPVTEADYRETLIPALDDAIASSDGLRALVVLDANMSDFTFGAMAADARTGLKHWRGFDRLAVVTGASGIAKAIRAVAVFMPCPVMTFGPEEREEARRWLRESLGTVHQTDLGGGALHIQLRGKLDPAVYARERGDLDAFFRKHDKVRLLVDLREFDGWQGLGALSEHFRLVRDHIRQVEKAAVVGDAGWQAMAVNVGKRLIGADARHFPAEDFEKSKDWITS